MPVLLSFVSETAQFFGIRTGVTVFSPGSHLSQRTPQKVTKRLKYRRVVLGAVSPDDGKVNATAREIAGEQPVNSKSGKLSSGNGVHVESVENVSMEKQVKVLSTERDEHSRASLTDMQPSVDEAQREEGVPVSLGPFSLSIPPRWLLYAVPFCWGSFAPAVRLLFSQERHQDPSVFNSERLILSTLVYLPVLVEEFNIYRNRDKNQQHASPTKPPSFLSAGLELGVYVFLANVAQVIGLQQTSASRAAFLGQLQTVFVPIISGLFGLDKVSKKTWLSSLVAVAGVALLSADKGNGTASTLTGDGLIIVSALFFSAYIIRLSNFCSDVPANPLVATKIAVQAVLSIGWALSAELLRTIYQTSADLPASEDYIPWTLGAVLINVGVVFWTGLLSSAASGWAQTKGQQKVPASEAVVIFATQPLWAGALAAAILGETFGPKGFAGGALIVAATLIAGRPGKDGEEEKEKDV